MLSHLDQFEELCGNPKKGFKIVDTLTGPRVQGLFRSSKGKLFQFPLFRYWFLTDTFRLGLNTTFRDLRFSHDTLSTFGIFVVVVFSDASS